MGVDDEYGRRQRFRQCHLGSRWESDHGYPPAGRQGSEQDPGRPIDQLWVSYTSRRPFRNRGQTEAYFDLPSDLHVQDHLRQTRHDRRRTRGQQEFKTGHL
jgi:hypothetical protein